MPQAFNADLSVDYSKWFGALLVNQMVSEVGGDPVSTGHVEVRSRVVDPRWPRKKRGKKVIANNDYALAA